MIHIISFFKFWYKKFLEHKFLSMVIIVIIFAGYYYFFQKTIATVNYQYTIVKKGSITSVVSGIGQVISNSQVDLKPKVNANVIGVYVHTGDRVKTGQILFKLDATDAYKQVRDALTALESAKLSLEKLKNPKMVDILSITNSIKQEEDAKKTQNQKVATAYRTLLTSNLQAVSEVSYTAETAPTITGSYLQGSEGQIKISLYQGGITGTSFSLSGIASGNGNVNTTVAQPLGDTGLYIKWNTAVPQTNWIIDIPNKQSISYSSNYEAWKNAVMNRDIANTASDRTIENLQQKLKDLTPNDDDLDVRSAKLQIEQRQNALLDAKTTLSNYMITAPFDGVMASVNVDVGSSAVMASANSSSALGTIVTDKKLAQVTLNEADVIKVRLGQKAKVTFDAIDGLELDGDVVEITTLGTVTSGVVTYKVKVAFTAGDPRILPNMSVAVDIITDSKDDVLYVPTQAVKHDASGYYVEEDTSTTTPQPTITKRFDNASSTRKYQFASGTMSTSTRYTRNGSSTSNYQKKNGATTTSKTVTNAILTRIPVIVGIQSDKQIEIVDGLHEGEQIILKKTTMTTTNNTAPSITSLLRPQSTARPTGTNAKAQ